MRDSENQLPLTHMTGSWGGRLGGEGDVRPTLTSAPDFRPIKLVHDASLTAACKKWLPFAPKSSVQIYQC